MSETGNNIQTVKTDKTGISAGYTGSTLRERAELTNRAGLVSLPILHTVFANRPL